MLPNHLTATKNNISEIWREYVGYEFDLELQSVLPAPDLVSNDNNYTDLVDGNQATCIEVNSTSCNSFKVRHFKKIKGIVFREYLKF